MALLTEEQIKDVMAMFDCYASGRYKKSFEYDFREWNEKQQPAAFEPDWSKAPKDATRAMLSLTWVFKEQTWALGHTIARYDRPAPVITPHPHAAMMLKYAEVAARRPDPWVEFEWRDFDKTWRKAGEMISFSSHTEYRHVGDEKEAV